MSVEAVLAEVGSAPGPVAVSGDGELARALRERLPAGAGAPRVVVETTGEPDAIRAALALVADLGKVVLAGPPPEPPVALDLYADLHVRGLTVVGVPQDAEEVVG